MVRTCAALVGGVGLVVGVRTCVLFFLLPRLRSVDVSDIHWAKDDEIQDVLD